MVRSRNVLNMLLMSFFTISIVTVVWIVVGYSLAFSEGTPLIGGFDFFFLRNTSSGPDLLNVMFQMTFAIITPALISGAVAERMKFSAWVLFTTLWALLVYPVIATWGIFADGLLYAWGG